MADTPTHTPGPWLQRVLLVVDARGNTITHCTRWEGPRPEPQVAEANAAFIVRACNSHYELLEALKAARLWVALYHSHLSSDPVSHPDAIANIVVDRQSIDDAIAKAEGR